MPGNRPYRVEYLTSVIDEDFPTLPKTARNIIKKAIEERLWLIQSGSESLCVTA